MEIDLIEIIRTGDISPFTWGCSSKEIIELLPKSEIIINDLRDREYPFIELDGVEFYFEEDDYKDLSEIIIKNWNYTKDYNSSFFDLGWLSRDLNYNETLKKLDSLQWNFEVIKSPYSDGKFLMTNKNVTLAFDEDSDDKLQKIFIKVSN